MTVRACTLICAAVLLSAGDAAAQTAAAQSNTGAKRASLLDRSVDLVLHEATLTLALTRLSQASGVPVAFSPSLVAAESRVVSCDCRDATVRKALDALLERTSFGYRELRGEVLVYLDVPAPAPPATLRDVRPDFRLASTVDPVGGAPPDEELQRPTLGIVQGRVFDAQSGAGIAGAFVSVVRTSIGTTTDADGAFVLRNVPPGQRRIRVRRLGYQELEQPVAVEAGVTVALNFPLRLDPVALRPLDVTVSTGTLAETEMRALGTSIAILHDEDIRVSGAKTLLELLHAAAPGVATFTTSGVRGSGGSIRIRGSTSFMQSQAPLIYIDGAPVDGGGSAANTMIRPDGLDSDRDINFGAGIRLDELDLEQIERIEIVKGPAATTMYGTDAVNGVIQIFTKRGVPGQTRITATIEQGRERAHVSQSFVQSSPFADELRRTLFRDPNTQRYNVTATGGQGSLSYTVGATHQRGAGVAIGNSEEQTALNASLGGVRGNDFSFRLSGNLVRRQFDQLNYRSLFVWAESNRTPAQGLVVASLSEVGRAGTLEEALELVNTTETKLSRVYGSANLMWRPFEFWQNNLTFGLDQSIEENESVGDTPHFYVFLGTYPAGFRRDRTTREFARYSARYVGTFSYPLDGPVRSTLSLGAEGYRDELRLIRLEAFGLPSRDVRGFIYSPNRNVADERYWATATVGGFVQQQVGVRDRLFVTAGLRADGSSTFGDDYGLQYYPKLSASYVIEPAAWWTGKLRTAWGRSGRAPNPFAKEFTFDILRSTSAVFGGEQRLIQRANTFGNPDVKPELGTEIELGAENYLWDNRVSFEANWFRQTTRDAILQGSIPRIYGALNGPLVNIGGLRSTGFELAGRFSPIRSGATSLGVGVTLTHMTENGVVTDLGELEFVDFIWNFQMGLKEGRSISEVVYQTNDGGCSQPECPSYEFVHAGSRVPTTYGGVTLDFRFLDGLRLYSNVAYGVGGRGFDYVRNLRDVAAGLHGQRPVQKEVAERRYIFKTDYLRVNTLRGLYQLPPGLLGALAREGELWIEAQNLATWTRAPNSDGVTMPPAGTKSFYVTGALDYTAVPIGRRYSAGLRLTF